ncbi:putative choline transport protein [Botrytis fragariae]|uniref:Putative choline transport protein n=1 Tax=Botrytis fragariae TaxID=1964551 RepID=A0A8H6ALQ1_9HELO|nr:putative choline transport protein [Botrytis fragariae]KAF5869575.1 putative choline transport protein [Botrytis fragariae]
MLAHTNFVIHLGWATVMGWIAATTAGAFFTSELIEGLAVQNNSEFVPTGWKGTPIFWAVLFLCVSINGFLSRALPILEVAILVVHILGFFAIIIPLVHLGPHGNAKEIFTTFVNTGWESQTLSFFIGLNGNIAAFTEEVKHASLNVPRSMLLSIFINGLLGFGMLLAVLFCAGDLNKAAESPTGFPFIAIFTNAVGSAKGANTMVSIVVLMSLAGAIAALASASRMMWSFARDRGLPWASKLSSVHSKTAIPLTAIVVVTICSALIGIINIGSSDAFNAVVSLVVEAFATSYLVPCSLLLYRRLKGQILEPKESFDVISTDKQLKWGEWRAKGWLGTAANVITCVYLSIVCFFAFWPATKPVTAVNMNYSSLVLGTVVIASLIYYLLWAKKVYQGPIMEVSVHAL